jgi:hypothetical protein
MNEQPRPNRDATGLALAAALFFCLGAAALPAAGQSAKQAPGSETAQVPADEIAAGIVFEDRNGNGRRDGGEPGVPGVSVSNGRDVVLSGPDGAYSLAVANGSILFISKPSGYAVPVDRDMLPRFHYIHAPDGTPAGLNLRYRGLDPTGPLPVSIDFALVRRPEPDDFEAIWFADPQPQTPAEIDYLRDDVLAELTGTAAAFGISVGDVTYDDLTLYPRLNRLIGSLGIPWYNLPGNHDLNFLSPDDRHSLETYKRTYGPAYYSFSYGQVHFVALDDVFYYGSNVGREAPNAWGAGVYEGRIGQDQLDWLARDLSFVPEDKLVVVTMHVPLRSSTSDSPIVTVSDRAALFAVLSKRKNLLVLTAHLHGVQHHYYGPEDGFTGAAPLHEHSLAAVSGGWWSGPLDERGIPAALQGDGTPNGYYIMSVRGSRATLRFKAAGKPADHQMRIDIEPVFEHPTMGPATPRGSYDPPIPRGRIEAMEIVVNLFDGGPKSRVAYRIGERPPVTMTPSRRIDNRFVKTALRVTDRNVFWTRRQDSTHIWAAPLPRDLAPGIHRLSVRAVDDYGQVHEAQRLFEIAP